MTQLSGKGRPIPMSWEYSRANRMYTDIHTPRIISQIAKKLYHLSQVCHKDIAKLTIIIGDYHPIYEKTRNKNKDI